MNEEAPNQRQVQALLQDPGAGFEIHSENNPAPTSPTPLSPGIPTPNVHLQVRPHPACPAEDPAPPRVVEAVSALASGSTVHLPHPLLRPGPVPPAVHPTSLFSVPRLPGIISCTSFVYTYVFHRALRTGHVPSPPLILLPCMSTGIPGFRGGGVDNSLLCGPDPPPRSAQAASSSWGSTVLRSGPHT